MIIDDFINGFWDFFSQLIGSFTGMLFYPFANAWITLVGLVDVLYIPIAGIYNALLSVNALFLSFFNFCFSWVGNRAFAVVFAIYLIIFALYFLLWLVRTIKDYIFRWA